MGNNSLNLTKSLQELNVNVQDLIRVELDYVRQVARASNGQFLVDRNTIPATQFMDKYFGGFEIEFLNDRTKQKDKKPRVRKFKINTHVKDLFPDLDEDMASKRASDTTRYITEIPFLFAFLGITALPNKLTLLTDRQYLETSIDQSKLKTPSETITDLLYCLPKAILEEPTFRQNFATATTIVDKIYINIAGYGNTLPVQFSWAANKNKDDETAVDIGFHYSEDKPTNIAGLQVKKTSELNGFNLSASDLGFNSQQGDDLFHVIAPQEFMLFWQDIVNHLLAQLNSTNIKWHTGNSEKYSILYENTGMFERYHLTGKTNPNIVTKHDLLNLNFTKGLRRVVGDYYQDNKDKFKVSGRTLWDAISTKIYTQVSNLKTLSRDKYYLIGGFKAKPYYHYSYNDNKLSYVPRIDDIKDSLSIDFNLRQQDSFNTGVIVDCSVKTGIIANDMGPELNKSSTTECRIRYHVGCFAGEPQMMIQGMKDTHNIWKEIK